MAFFLLPNAPLQTRWLTPAQRQLAHSRIEQDTTQKRDKVNVWKGLREAAVDYRTWIFALMQNLHLSGKLCLYEMHVRHTLTSCFSEWLQKLPTNSRADVRFQPNNHPRIDLPSVSHLSLRVCSSILVIWSLQRAHLAHHALQSRCDCGLHRGDCHLEHWRAVFRHGAIRRSDLWCQQHRAGLDRRCARPDGREEISRIGYRQYVGQPLLRLHAVSVARQRCAALWQGHVCERGLLGGCGTVCVGDETCVNERQQEDPCIGQRGYQLLCVLAKRRRPPGDLLSLAFAFHGMAE
jgi:hypothetical protein